MRLRSKSKEPREHSLTSPDTGQQPLHVTHKFICMHLCVEPDCKLVVGVHRVGSKSKTINYRQYVNLNTSIVTEQGGGPPCVASMASMHCGIVHQHLEFYRRSMAPLLHENVNQHLRLHWWKWETMLVQLSIYTVIVWLSSDQAKKKPRT